TEDELVERDATAMPIVLEDVRSSSGSDLGMGPRKGQSDTTRSMKRRETSKTPTHPTRGFVCWVDVEGQPRGSCDAADPDACRGACNGIEGMCISGTCICLIKRSKLPQLPRRENGKPFLTRRDGTDFHQRRAVSDYSALGISAVGILGPRLIPPPHTRPPSPLTPYSHPITPGQVSEIKH
ncbi:hypothetical protein BaRGS_00036751, partial [Batillaria attramentaria]